MHTKELYDEIAFLEPWVRVREYANNLEKELCKEITKGHPLYSRHVTAIAQRTDCDDVLFEVDSPDYSYVVVHLSWTGEPENDLRWPDTQCFRDIQDWVENCMKKDNQGFIQK